MQTNETTELVGSKQVCEHLGIDRSTLSRWVAAGRLTPALRLPTANGAFLFNRADIDALVQERAS